MSSFKIAILKHNYCYPHLLAIEHCLSYYFVFRDIVYPSDWGTDTKVSEGSSGMNLLHCLMLCMVLTLFGLQFRV